MPSVVLKPVTITPAPTIITPHLAVEVDRVGVNRIECMTGETDGCARAHVAVGVKITNRGSGPATVRVDDAQLLVNPRPSDPRSARAVEHDRVGAGTLLVDIDDHSEAAPVTLEPGASMDAWVDFTGFDGDSDSAYRPRLALSVPFEVGRRPRGGGDPVGSVGGGAGAAVQPADRQRHRRRGRLDRMCPDAAPSRACR